ncbi:hypothetical protein H4696_006008 [Amycolatopsis lexingtonensis]|uniref:Uncharacterized protein n=1 Tax=Amycolatopsis lexingtonensis TaxID=218822 RepID=A0ABR9I6W5_9PSEU|nr:hypothetical protein [Amycolatopsis lexingtonensis]MBE1498908.1 hypothetical protein [Amycolatopsis lexingtonensis]
MLVHTSGEWDVLRTADARVVTRPVVLIARRFPLPGLLIAALFVSFTAVRRRRSWPGRDR